MKRKTRWHLVAGAALVAAIGISSSAWARVPTFQEAPALKGDSDFCLGKDDGSYEHPDCRMHYSCKRGIATQVSCPEGQVFDSDKNPNDNPAMSYCSVPAKDSSVDCDSIHMVK
jgi:hypothetical protein